jgi:hypothetical protein
VSETSLKTVRSDVRGRLNKMIENSSRSTLRGFLNRDVYAAYRMLQERRWETENQSEGNRWEILKSEGYKRWKAVTYGADRATGRPLLIASGTLKRSVIGPSTQDGFRKVVTDKGLFISTSVIYAQRNDEMRTFSTYSRASWAAIRKMVSDFVARNKTRTFAK